MTKKIQETTSFPFAPDQHVFYVKEQVKAVVKAVDVAQNKVYISFHPKKGSKKRINKWVPAKTVKVWMSKKNQKNVNKEEGSNRYYNQIREFHLAFGQPAPNTPTRLTQERKQFRIGWMQEELGEYKKADTLYDEVDALIDLLYFTVGTLVEHGVKPDSIFDIVQNANMSKLWNDGKPRFREGDNKIIKPDGWVAPEPLIRMEIKRQFEEAIGQ